MAKHNISISITANQDLDLITNILLEYETNTIQTFLSGLQNFKINVCDMPFIYPEYSRKPKYRKVPLEYGYILFYKINKQRKIIQIQRILHSKQNIDKMLK